MIEFKCKHLMNIISIRCGSIIPLKSKLYYDERKMTIKSLIRGKSVIMFLLILLIDFSLFSQLVPRPIKIHTPGQQGI